MIYDGDCAYCRAQMQRMRRRDPKARFEFVPSQDSELLSRFPQLANEDFNTGLRLVDADGTVFVGAEAVYQISRHLSGARWFAWLYRVPGLGWLARRVYAWIAVRRRTLA